MKIPVNPSELRCGCARGRVLLCIGDAVAILLAARLQVTERRLVPLTRMLAWVSGPGARGRRPRLVTT